MPIRSTSPVTVATIAVEELLRLVLTGRPLDPKEQARAMKRVMTRTLTGR